MVLRPTLRIACAITAILAFVGALANLLRLGGSVFHALPIVFAGFFAVLAMFGGGKPPAPELPRIEEQLRRFRNAMLLCFGAAWALYLSAAISRRHVQELASLGVAFWIAAFVLMFFVVHYRAQRRLAAE